MTPDLLNHVRDSTELGAKLLTSEESHILYSTTVNTAAIHKRQTFFNLSVTSIEKERTGLTDFTNLDTGVLIM